MALQFIDLVNKYSFTTRANTTICLFLRNCIMTVIAELLILLHPNETSIANNEWSPLSQCERRMPSTCFSRSTRVTNNFTRPFSCLPTIFIFRLVTPLDIKGIYIHLRTVPEIVLLPMILYVWVSLVLCPEVILE